MTSSIQRIMLRASELKVSLRVGLSLLLLISLSLSTPFRKYGDEFL